jgi:hypothetical protein
MVITGMISSVCSRDFFATILFLSLGIHALLKRGLLWACLVLIPRSRYSPRDRARA